jgi:pyridoxal phosphate enzyme (YggS family)
VNQIAENIQAVLERIITAAGASGRTAEEILLLAISKNFPEESISQAASAGLRCFGENRVQEAEGKILHFRKVLNLEWHLVGHLQSNKARRAAELFDVIHSLDSVRLGAKLNQASLEIGKTMSVLIQVDLGKEDTKFGVDSSQVREIVEGLSKFRNLRINGLMTIPPFFENPDDARPFFAQLRKLRDLLELENPGCLGQQHLSMGMSHDFEIAIQEGATIIRVGTAIFGSRHYG